MSNNYKDAFKEAMVKKMIGPTAMSAAALAEQAGVAQTTLSRWLKQYGNISEAGGNMGSKKRAQNWTAEEKLKAVLEYEALDEEVRGKHLREKGLYEVEIRRWREEMLQALKKKPKRGDAKERRIRELEGELQRKEKALAETAALLVLKKKAQAIWGDGEDEK